MKTTSLPPPVWVSKPSELKHLSDELRTQPRAAVDTESNSLHAYREQVCLIQISTPQYDYLIDSIELTDLDALSPFFANPKIEKIFHAAEYDVICLHRDYGFRFNGLFDTVIAARILGHKVIGLGDLLAEYFNVEVNKQFQKSNWGKRPLTAEQVDYARLDTHYLIDLRDILEKELREKNLLELAREDFKRACQPANGNGKKPRASWERISGHQDLTPRQLSILNELCVCREEIAEQLDRPVFKVINDDMLLSIAQTMPDSAKGLDEAGLTKLQIEKFGSKLLQAIRAGCNAQPVARTRSRRLNDTTLARLEKLKEWRKKEAAGIKVESDIVLPKPMLNVIAEQGPRDMEKLSILMAESPWRFRHFGESILKVLESKGKTKSTPENS